MKKEKAIWLPPPSPSPGRIGCLASHPMRCGYRRGPAAGRCGERGRGRGMDGPCVNKCGGGTWAGGRRRGLARARAVSGSWAASSSARCRRTSLGGVSRSGTRVRTKRARPHLSPAGARHLADVWARTPPADVVSRLSQSRRVCVDCVRSSGTASARHRTDRDPSSEHDCRWAH